MDHPKDTECKNFILSIKLMAKHLDSMAENFDLDSVREMLNNIFAAESIFVMGAGRSGLVGRAFAMRLMHLGFNVYVVGETTTPAVKKDDVVIGISGSGETRSIVDLGRIAAEIGSTLISVTSNKESTLGEMADTAVVIPGRIKDNGGGYLERHMRGDYRNLTPLGTSFEISSMVFLDAVIAELIAIMGVSEADLKLRHTTLE
ncbi:6-phospho 3-hexuloisomerase [Methanosalsum zhilinae DSM 4017]|uniref:6-phospho 3-hexuloisomerase n=1 Tax=Methanosalsum zhilinae (strain DSM 4017 / NBRC 107636 / OCM 62 / WeN5) TaxID=679901 RepID=F7XKI1_METZD|nr:6-phospho-3-hexuloisomerase [Methanosalsum zhilinae]AEH61755.1 6-phospho 3-hexuloisomerase [Methanosalsum zhilinae DSM 4017]